MFNSLKALITIAPKKDVRYYLNGIHIDLDGILVVTDGSILLKIEDLDVTNEGNETVVMCRKSLDLTLKYFRASDKLSITIKENGEVYLNERKVDTIEGRFPDYKRVIDTSHFDTYSRVGVDPKLLSRLLNAFTLSGKSYKKSDGVNTSVVMTPRGETGALQFACKDMNMFGLLMPYKIRD